MSRAVSRAAGRAAGRTGRRRLSLRVRITAGALLVVLLAVAGAGRAVIGVLEHEMLEQVDASLTSTADYVDRALTSGEGLPTEEGPNDLYVQFLAADGRVLGASDAALGAPALTTPLRKGPGGITTAETARFGTVRVLTEPSPVDPSVTLVLAKSSEHVGEVRRSLERLLLAMTAGLTVFLGLVVWVVVGRALRPVDTMARSAAAMDDRDLSRLDRPGTGDELDRLADTLNDLLERLDAALTRERRFVSDASHDLRTPITGVRALLESEPHDLAAVRASRAEALAAVDALADLVDDLLELARADGIAGAPAPFLGGPVDLDDLVLAQARSLERSTGLSIDTTGVSGGQVHGRDTELGRVVENLAANAARYAVSTITFAVRQEGETVVFTVTDDGPGIPESDRSRVFERFTTLDDSRSGARGGTGLGLSIVAAIVAGHGGTVTVGDGDGRGARFTVRLPAADRSAVELPV
ncbi:MAG: HAMP domain-containing histidine kinase [Acidimicrobiales bacterium]|nr:HAMP domain-containing histidine kinase [Acidimicrobiales bacterium]